MAVLFPGMIGGPIGRPVGRGYELETIAWYAQCSKCMKECLVSELTVVEEEEPMYLCEDCLYKSTHRGALQLDHTILVAQPDPSIRDGPTNL